MPLVRYEIRNEYSLANPDLYRAAAKDDPEGLLEGVAMAGLVGIVRQLGDLAEFAAEVFHDLHEEILATAARGHELMIRVQQLESELPLIEKMMFSETKNNHDTFIYSQGIVWHPELRNDQNHFTQGDLPHFIRNAYEECRGPPRLFLLDKFDVAGAGACLKRYTDPFFFKMEWASTELMKAEKEQQDRKARRIRKKRQAVELGSRASDNFGLRPSEDGSRIVKDVHNGTVKQRQAGEISSLKSKKVSERSTKNVSVTSKDGYSEPVIERQAVDINSLTSENAALKTSKADSRMLKDACIDPVKERQAVDTSPRTSENVILRPLEDDSKILKDTYSAPVMQGPATDISSMNSEKVVMSKTEDSFNMLKDDYSTPVMQREAVDIGSSASDSDDLKPMKNGARILKDAPTTPVMQRQDSSSTSESVDLKTTEDDHPRTLKDDYVGSAMQRQSTDIDLVESKYASSKMPEDVLKTPGDNVLMVPVGSTLRTSEHASLKMAEDAGNESFTKMSEDADTESSTKQDTVPRMCEDIAQNISEEAAVTISDIATPMIGEDEVQKMSEDAVLRMSEDAVQKISQDAGLRTSEGPSLRTLTDHVLRTSDDDILRAIEVTDDFASETENFVDALATMDSEVETDTETKAKFEDEEGDYFVASSKTSSNNFADTNSETLMVNYKTLDNDCKNEEQREEKNFASIKFSQDSPERDFSIEDSTQEEHQTGMMNMPDKEKAIDKIDLDQQVSRLDIDGDVQSTMERIELMQQVSGLDIDGDVQSTMERIDLMQQLNESNMDGNVHDNYSNSLKENEREVDVDESPRHTNGFIDAYPSPRRDCDVFKTDDHDESESIESIPETPEDSETDDDGGVETENLSELPMSTGALGDGSRNKFSKWHGSRSSDRVLQSTNDAFYRGLSDLSSEDSESELSDSVKETSPRSSANSSIRPIKWVSKSHDSSSGSNDEMDGTQVSSASSSTLSSPRPSTLATTVFSVDSENQKYKLSPERPMKNSLVSHLSESPKSAASTVSEIGTRDVSPELTAEKPAETLNSEPLESPSSEMLRSRASEHVIFDPRTMTSTSATVLGATAETLKYTSEAFIFPSVEPLRSLSEPSITKSAESTAGLASQSMVMNSNLSTESSMSFHAKYTGSPQFVNVELEQFPPPPPLPPLQWRMSRRLQKNTSVAYKEEESHSVSVPENSPTDYDIRLKDFNSSANESPALQILESTRWPAENLNLQHAPVMVNDESQPVTRSSLDLQKLPSSSEIAGIPNERFSAFQDDVLHVSSVVPSQVIDISSTSYNSSETLSTKPVNLDPLQSAITVVEEYPVEENVLMQSILQPSSQDSVSFPAGFVKHETAKKSCKPSESCYNSQLLGYEGSPVVAAPSQAFDASDTSDESKKQLVMPEETLELCKTMKLASSPSVDREKDAAVSTAVSSCENIQKGLILNKLENAEDCFSSHSKLQENINLAGSSCTSSKIDDHSNILESKQDVHMHAAMLDRPKIVDAHSPVSEHTGEIMSSPEQPDNVVKPKSSLLARLQKKNPLIEAIASHDRSTLRKVPEPSQSSSTVTSDERGVLLEQIRNRSFSLRQIKVEKQAAPQPVTNINVAAILEKANAIRQAFAGSDDEDDWSDG